MKYYLHVKNYKLNVGTEPCDYVKSVLAEIIYRYLFFLALTCSSEQNLLRRLWGMLVSDALLESRARQYRHIFSATNKAADYTVGTRIFLSATVSKTVLWLTKLPTHRLPGTLSLWLKQLEFDSDSCHHLLSSVMVRYAFVAWCLSTRTTSPFYISLQIRFTYVTRYRILPWKKPRCAHHSPSLT